ncbi:GNAT family N-acetyltransferase [Nocardia huaxiensis]|uniref:GNAT family N-acetyltransferase n=1 Tax=Nocardia huaxiensis TaxID=2755382 RepID=UPI001E2968B4|nr:GNAT family N-acetyltransferase [Nocardia huaxiensis]UFS98083.1 GNAT family N-acetyltransferase [Nocardia huaxiensis]
MDVTVRPALSSDIPELGRVLGIAFQDDPIPMWLIPDEAARARRNAIMFATLTRHQFLDGGGVEVALDDTGAMVGAAVWAPPGLWQTSKLTLLRCLPGLGRAFRTRLPQAAKMSDRMAEHHPREPHWYLAFIGTLPSARGKGFGQALLHSRLERCDAEGVPAYLESSKPDNVPYYERFGFEKNGELDATNGGPLLWPMWRTPR